MFVYFKYFVLIVCFNQCFSASNLIQTAIYNPRYPLSEQQYNTAGHLSGSHDHYYPIYPMSHSPNADELHFSASFAQPILDIPRGGQSVRNMVNSRSLAQKPKSVQKPTESQSQRDGHLSDSLRIPTFRDISQKIINQREPSQRESSQREPLQRESQTRPVTSPQKLSPAPNPGQPKPLTPMPVMFKAHISSTTLKVPSNSFQLNTNTDSNKKKKPTFNDTTVARVESIRFNWPKSRLLSQKNYSQNYEILTKEALQQKTPQKYNYNSNTDSYKRANSESQQNYRYYSTQPMESVPTTEITRKTTTTTTPIPTEVVYQTKAITTEGFKEEIPDSDKRDLDKQSSDDSLSYPQFFDSSKLDDSLESTEQNKDQIPQYGYSMSENSGVTIPENEVNYVHPEAEPEPEVTEPYVENLDKQYEQPIDESKGPELKSLLEQFIQQLELLKFVASKELQKTMSSNIASESVEDKIIQSSNAELLQPSQSLQTKTGVTYDEYQNERSFEQNLSNSDSKVYQDTNNKNGRYGERLNVTNIPKLVSVNSLTPITSKPFYVSEKSSQTEKPKAESKTTPELNLKSPFLLSTADFVNVFYKPLNQKNESYFKPIISDIREVPCNNNKKAANMGSLSLFGHHHY